MYSKSRYSNRENIAEDDALSEEEAELLRYRLPPRYDGSRFSRTPHDSRQSQDPRQAQSSRVPQASRDSQNPSASQNRHDRREHSRSTRRDVDLGDALDVSGNIVDTSDDVSAESLASQRAEAHENAAPRELSQILGNISSEDLLIISLILTVAGSDGGNELMLFLILLLLHA